MFDEHGPLGAENLLVLYDGLDLLSDFCHVGFSACLERIDQVLGLGIDWVAELVLGSQNLPQLTCISAGQLLMLLWLCFL